MKLKTLVSHIRDMRMVMNPNTIIYTIPLYSEKEHLGKVLNAKVVGENLIITAEVKPEMKKDIPFLVSFN